MGKNRRCYKCGGLGHRKRDNREIERQTKPRGQKQESAGEKKKIEREKKEKEEMKKQEVKGRKEGKKEEEKELKELKEKKKEREKGRERWPSVVVWSKDIRVQMGDLEEVGETIFRDNNMDK